MVFHNKIKRRTTEEKSKKKRRRMKKSFSLSAHQAKGKFNFRKDQTKLEKLTRPFFSLSYFPFISSLTAKE